MQAKTIKMPANNTTMQIAFYKGRRRLFNRLTAWWTNGPYSHCELIVEGVCWSSSFMDGGVRGKRMNLNLEHWDVIEVAGNAADAQQWFFNHFGDDYDVLGLVGFVWRPWRDNKDRWVCSEAIAAALGFVQPWRFCPNTLYAALSRPGHSGLPLTAAAVGPSE